MLSLFIRRLGYIIFLFLENRMAIDLSELILIPHSMHQRSIRIRSFWSIRPISKGEKPDRHIEESSANSEEKVESFRIGKSFMNILNNKGLSTLPWGMPLLGENFLEKQFPILTLEDLLVRKFFL